MKYSAIVLIFLSQLHLRSQQFNRSELPTSLNSPWEIIYGPDNFLWLTEAGGKIVRVNPNTGSKTTVYTAPDYFGGSPLEQLNACFQPNIGVGTLGMALRTEAVSGNYQIFYVYSYNSGTSSAPATKFKIARVTWNSSSQTVVSDSTIVTGLPTGYDHLGGRLMIIPRNGIPYLFVSIGDNGVSETNEPTCYSPQSTNPNNFAQDPMHGNGKIHRFHLDGSVPADNPLPGNSFYTRGHRNPQGLIYNSNQDVIYDVEHGDRTDDEINILNAGMNYGWKYVRGFHGDNNYPGEANYVATYTPYPGIANDALVEPLFAWCSTPQPTVSAFLDWCTVAPSDGIYYNSNGVPQWNNSLLVVTLKDGLVTDEEVYCFKLNADGKSLKPSTSSDPNPSRFFGADQAMNGRLRDITYSPDGTKFYLINNGGVSGATSDKITVYTYDPFAGLINIPGGDFFLKVYPVPGKDEVCLKSNESITEVKLMNVLGVVQSTSFSQSALKLDGITPGTYVVEVTFGSGRIITRKLVVN